MKKRTLLIAGNWKMNGSTTFTRTLLEELIKKIKKEKNDLVVFPPFVYLPLAKEILKNSPIQFGAQDVSAHDQGAYTGEISANMLADMGCQYAIAGHSERRAFHHESSVLAVKKCVAAHHHGLTPILCLGETQSERDEGHTFDIISKQLLPLFEFPDVLHRAVLAYEPVWAIGTGKTATPEQAEEVHHFIREQVGKKDPSIAMEIRILYGGSVKADNAHVLFSMPNIDGGLIGGASLKTDEFISLCQIQI